MSSLWESPSIVPALYKQFGWKKSSQTEKSYSITERTDGQYEVNVDIFRSLGGCLVEAGHQHKVCRSLTEAQSYLKRL
jgi:hypothetical protein